MTFSQDVETAKSSKYSKYVFTNIKFFNNYFLLNWHKMK